MTEAEKKILYGVLLRLIDNGENLTPLERRDLINKVISAHCDQTADEILALTTNNRKLQIKRGNAAKNSAYTGVPGELTMNTDLNTLCVHDGHTPGGTVLARMADIQTQTELPDNMVYITETGSNETCWWRKYSNGYMDMGGHYTGNSGTVHFPFELADTNFDIMIDKNSAPPFWASTHICIEVVTKTYFTVKQFGDTAVMRIGWLITNARLAEE